MEWHAGFYGIVQRKRDNTNKKENAHSTILGLKMEKMKAQEREELGTSKVSLRS